MNRHTARETALQMLFQMDIGNNSYEIALNTLEEAAFSKKLMLFTEELVKGVLQNMAELDVRINSHSRNWQLDRLSGVDRAILRLAVYELAYTAETPANVVINEAIELAKYFSSDEAPAFVNGILDSIWTELRVQNAKREADLQNASAEKTLMQEEKVIE